MGPASQWRRYNFCKVIIPWLQPSRLRVKKKKQPERVKCYLKYKDFHIMISQQWMQMNEKSHDGPFKAV